jgi:NADPH:quinone reductase
MYQVMVKRFGDVDQLEVIDIPDLIPEPNSNQVLIRVTSIGMNYADLMARRGEYKLISGSPPFTPGLEAGGYIEAVGSQVTDRIVGQRVLLSLGASAANGVGRGTYQSHYVTTADRTVLAPDEIADELLGAIWLPYMTAWGCLIWRQQLQPGQTVLLPAASSSVAIAAAQIVKNYGGIAIGTTSSPGKVEALQAMPEATYDHLVGTHDREWWREVKQITHGQGVDVIFDPIAAGAFLNQETRVLANHGTLWIYGLLGKPDVVDVTPLIRKMATMRGWLVNEIAGTEYEQLGYQHILACFANQTYQLPIARKFPLDKIRQAHTEMEQGQHIGKFILVP